MGCRWGAGAEDATAREREEARRNPKNYLWLLLLLWGGVTVRCASERWRHNGSDQEKCGGVQRIICGQLWCWCGVGCPCAGRWRGRNGRGHEKCGGSQRELSVIVGVGVGYGVGWLAGGEGAVGMNQGEGAVQGICGELNV